MIYVYDGTWDGMMTLICRTAQEGAPEDIARSSGGRPLLDFTLVPTDPAMAEGAAAALEARLGGRAIRDAYLALATEGPGIDLAVWGYLARLWAEGRRAGGDLADERVGRVFHAARAAARELDHWLGWTRFQDRGAAYYSAIEPACDLLPLLAEHFAQRFPHRWVLHDTRRGKAALHGEGQWMILEDIPPEGASYRPPSGASCRPPAELPAPTAEEGEFQELWREFFRSVAIPERPNPRCQRNFLPKRAWRCLVEDPGEHEMAM